LELEWADLELRIHPEIVSGNGRSDEPGGRGLEGYCSHLDPPDNLVLESLVIDLNVVVGGEVPLRVVINSKMDSLADNPPAPHVDLVVQSRRLEPTPAAGVRVQKQGWTAALVPKPVGTQLQSYLAIHGQVGILLGQPENAPVGLRRPVLRQVFRWRRPVQRQQA
jgi:hypothetical protein